MEALSKIVPIYLNLLVAYTIFSFLNTVVWISKIKSGIYEIYLNKVPVLNYFFPEPLRFETWWGFTVGAWFVNAFPGYILATLLVGRAYKISVDNYGVLYPAFLVGQIVPVLTSMIFLYLQVGELPNRLEWIALILFFVGSIILANSR